MTAVLSMMYQAPMSTASPPQCDSIRQTIDGTHEQGSDTQKSSYVSAPIADVVSETSSPGCSGLPRQHFRDKAVLVNNALRATSSHRTSDESRRGTVRPSPSSGASGTGHVAGSKSFAALGHAVIVSNRRGRGDTAAGPRHARPSPDSAAADDHSTHTGANHTRSPPAGHGSDTVQLVLADEDSIRDVDTTLVFEITRPFFTSMKFVGLFFVRRAQQVVNDFEGFQPHQATEGGLATGYDNCWRSAAQRAARRVALACWSPAQVLGAATTVLLVANFVRSMFSVKVSRRLITRYIRYVYG